MSLKHGLLGLLNYEPKTGYELDKFFKESLAYFWQAKGSQIYRELDAMEKSGWLASERVLQEEKPNKRVYSITQEGKEELTKWLINFDLDKSVNAGLKNPFLMRIFFGGEVDKEENLRFLRDTRQKLEAHFEELMDACKDGINDCDNGIDPNIVKYWNLTALFGEIAYKAQLEWINIAIKTLEEGETEREISHE